MATDAQRSLARAGPAPRARADAGSSAGRLALLMASGVLMLADLALIFLWVPTEQVMGVVQRVFYFHVPLAWSAFLAFFVVFIGGAVYLWRGNWRWDALAFASAEVGVLFTTLVLVTGSIWAKPVWGVWWDWDPKLTTSLILWLIYIGYLMVRAYAPTPAQAARYAAVVGTVGFLDVPIVYMASTWWVRVHPQAIVGPLSEENSLEGSMLLVLLFSLLTFTVLLAYLIWERYRLRTAEDTLRAMGAQEAGA